MEYWIEKVSGEQGYYRLREKETDSVVRIQTNNHLLARTFWEHYLKD